MPKSLVTGGAGFIGSNLVDALISSGHDVVCVDDESSQSSDAHRWNSHAENHKVDIVDFRSMLPLFSGVDFVFHLAAESRIGITMNDPVKTFNTNVSGTVSVLQCAKVCGSKRVVLSSTSSAYGRNPTPNSEDQPDDPLNPYSVSKVAAEKACFMYHELYGLETVVLRYFNVYGPREPKKGQYAPVIGIFKRQRSAGESLTVVGDGTQRRDFTHVYDVVRANMLAAEAKLEPADFKLPFNIGSGTNISINEIADAMHDKKVFLPARPGEMKETLADNSRAMQKLGWRPTFKVEDYISSLS
jgi:UDP-glucose 4-epimerase